LNSAGFEEKVGETQMSLLCDQEAAMRLYLKTLAERIDDLEDNMGEGEPKEKSREEGPKSTKKGTKKAMKTKEEDEEEMPEFVKDILGVMEKYLDKEK